ncbi:MAG: sulfotransferase, partial [Bacteroidota bacterium]
MIFVAGNSRSGTTLMGRILGKHTTVFTFNELHFLEEKWMPVDEKISMTYDEALFNFSNLISIQ